MITESWKTATAKTNAAQRAILAGDAITASAPTTGKNNIHVKSFANIITNPLRDAIYRIPISYRVRAGHPALAPALAVPSLKDSPYRACPRPGCPAILIALV